MLTGGSSSVETVEGMQVLKLDFDASNKATADIEASSLNVTSDVVKVKISIYVYGDEPIKLTLRSKCQDSSVYDEVTTVTLNAGWNEISVSTLSFGCQTYGALKYLRFTPQTSEAVAIALGQITLEG